MQGAHSSAGRGVLLMGSSIHLETLSDGLTSTSLPLFIPSPLLSPRFQGQPSRILSATFIPHFSVSFSDCTEPLSSSSQNPSYLSHPFPGVLWVPGHLRLSQDWTQSSIGQEHREASPVPDAELQPSSERSSLPGLRF